MLLSTFRLASRTLSLILTTTPPYRLPVLQTRNHRLSGIWLSSDKVRTYTWVCSLQNLCHTSNKNEGQPGSSPGSCHRSNPAGVLAPLAGKELRTRLSTEFRRGRSSRWRGSFWKGGFGFTKMQVPEGAGTWTEEGPGHPVKLFQSFEKNDQGNTWNAPPSQEQEEHRAP